MADPSICILCQSALDSVTSFGVSFMLSPLLWGGVASVSDFEPEWFMGRENVVFERRNLTFLLKMSG